MRVRETEKTEGREQIWRSFSCWI